MNSLLSDPVDEFEWLVAPTEHEQGLLNRLENDRLACGRSSSAPHRGVTASSAKKETRVIPIVVSSSDA